VSAAATDNLAELNDQLISDMGRFTHDPAGFVRYAYPWGEAGLEDSTGPRKWQDQLFQLIAEHLGNPEKRFTPCCIAVASGHGIGKSAAVGMVIGWAKSTCEDTKIVVTANTARQLSTKTVPEVTKWERMAINADWWDVALESIKAKEPGHGETWRCDFMPWSVSNSTAFAGLHNARKRIILIFDEAAEIADVIWEVAEGALTDEFTEIIWLAFGNPTKNSGRFRECFGARAHRWKTLHVDAREVEGTNKAQLAAWVADYGEDSDFVRARVRGEFPRAGFNEFIPADAVAECRKFKAPAGYEQLPKIFGVDVARFGDDKTVVFMRQGRKSGVLGVYRGLDTAQVTAHVIEFIEREQPDAVVVDSDGIGNTVFDQLKFQGYGKRLYEFHGGKPANNHSAYFNRRAEVWGEMRDALKAGMEIPDNVDLAADLTAPQYGFSPQQQIQLEKKDDMKKRGLSSPDFGDALAMTFAVKIAPRPKAKMGSRNAGPHGWMS
jgi:hypothetical protein